MRFSCLEKSQLQSAMNEQYLLLTPLPLSIVSAALTDCTCGCPHDPSQPDAKQNNEKRDSPPPILDPSHLEHAMDMTPEPIMRMRCSESNSNRKQMLQDCNLPSGLSVEDDDFAEVHV